MYRNLDTGLIMSHQVYTKNHLVQGTMTAAEWDFFCEIIDDYQNTLPLPNIVVYLTAKPTTQLKRIKARGRSFEAGYTLEYLKQITDRLEEYEQSLQNQESVSLIKLDTERYNLTRNPGLNHFLSLVKAALKTSK